MLHDPGPAVIYGYYVMAAALALLRVALRGWRALIHLSFLFTLAGGLFFGFTRVYQAPEHFAIMLPLLRFPDLAGPLLDFGALCELANIVALIAAGVVFLSVTWFAPLPPAQASARR